jgi:hypothetical protein
MNIPETVTGSSSEPALARPSAHPLQDCLRELKFGRPVADQVFLDECIAKLDEVIDPNQETLIP